jgi:antitoxin ParD1/3/4
MQTISINIPDALSDFVHQQAAEHGIDDYFERILRDQQREKARDRLEAELIKGIESGFGEPITPEYWEKMREKLQQHIIRKQESIQ